MISATALPLNQELTQVYNKRVAHSVGNFAEKQMVLGPHCRLNMEGARTPPEHCPGTHKQGTEPTGAHIGLCDKLETHPGVDHAFTHCVPPHDPKGIKMVKMRRETKISLGLITCEDTRVPF